MKTLLGFSRRHRGKAVALVAIAAVGAALAASPFLRAQSDRILHATLVWAGLGEPAAGVSTIYWCPMHPQIKSNKENAVCPICNMALVELEGGLLESSQHLTLTVQQVQQAGVVTEAVLRRKLYREIDTTGRIKYDERRYAGISSWIVGKSRIEKLHVNFTGEFVKQGTPMAELYSPSLLTAQHEYLAAKASSSSRRDDRMDNQAGDRYRITTGQLLRAARQKLEYQGLTAAQIDRLHDTGEIVDRIAIHAPISGTVIERHVQEGQYVQEGDWLYHLADLSHLWLVADIYEDELQLIEIGGRVDLSVRAFPGDTFSGEIAFVDPKVNPETRAVGVRVDVENHDGKLMPGMYARARVRREYPSALAVPENAVLWSGQRTIVILKSGEGTFRPQEVKLGMRWLYESDNEPAPSRSLGFGKERARYHTVLAGLSPGEEVVTAGAFLLNAESQFQNVLAKMLPPASEPATLEQVLGEPVAAQVRELLSAYFQLSQALADDRLDEVPARIGSLQQAAQLLAQAASVAGAGDLAADAARFQALVQGLNGDAPKDLHKARTRFGRISHQLASLLANHGGKTLMGKELFMFECGMAKVGYEKWLWWSPETYNPYMGQKMLTCGTRLDSLSP